LLEAEAAIQALIPMLLHRSPPVVQAAAEGLGELERPEAVGPLMEAYERADSGGDKGCHTRTAIVIALGKIGIASAEPVIRRAINTVQIEAVGGGREDTAITLRAVAAGALARVDPENAIHDLALMLFDTEPNLEVAYTERVFSKARTRSAAGKAIAYLGYATGAALLGVKLKFRQGEVSEVLGDCLEAFIAMDPPNVLEIARPYLEGDDAFLSGMAATSLARFRGEDALDVLADSFEEIPREARVPTILAITGIRSSRTGQTLLRFFDDRDPAVRLAAVQGAVLYRDRQITDRLVLIAQSDPDPRVRAAAQRAMD
jgi:HEAT repeat protein